MKPICLIDIGLSQVLHAEIAPLGLRSLIVDLGYFRTKIIDNVNSYESRITDYDPMTDKCYKALKGVIRGEI